jgi:hypothetical protein
VQAPLDCAGIVVEPDGTQQEYPGRAGLTFYRCGTSTFLGVHDRSTVQFQLKINQVIPGATGTVSFHDPYAVPPDPPPDTDPSNDTALVVINPIDVD